MDARPPTFVRDGELPIDPISPELVLVSSPEDAARARELLPPVVAGPMSPAARRWEAEPSAEPLEVVPATRSLVSTVAAVGICCLVTFTLSLRDSPESPAAPQEPLASGAFSASTSPAPASTTAQAGAQPTGGAADQRLLSWRAVPRATYYNVQVFRDELRVFEAWPSTTELALPAAWEYQGGSYRLSPGTYTVFVWAGYGDKTVARYAESHQTRILYVAK